MLCQTHWESNSCCSVPVTYPTTFIDDTVAVLDLRTGRQTTQRLPVGFMSTELVLREQPPGNSRVHVASVAELRWMGAVLARRLVQRREQRARLVRLSNGSSRET